jgi:segregation and condensation protein B
MQASVYICPLNFLQNHIEALIFCSSAPMKIDEIQSCLNEMLETEIPLADINDSLQTLLEKYSSDEFSFQIYQISEGYQFLSKPAYQASIQILLKQKSKKRLSTAALETLSIIAYKQPVTKTEIEQVRGVSCDYALQKLLDKELIVIKGKSDAVGRPLLYGTSQKFIEYFGLNSLKDLPQPKDFAASDNEIGQSNE